MEEQSQEGDRAEPGREPNAPAGEPLPEPPELPTRAAGDRAGAPGREDLLEPVPGTGASRHGVWRDRSAGRGWKRNRRGDDSSSGPRRRSFVSCRSCTKSSIPVRHIRRRSRRCQPPSRRSLSRRSRRRCLASPAPRPVVPVPADRGVAGVGHGSRGASCNRVLTGGELHCYPATYGLGGCAAHDATREPHCDGASPAGFCAEPWCYVDPDACRGSVKRFHQSDVLIDAGVSAFYSYDTCGGDEESWNDVMVSSVLSGKTLRPPWRCRTTTPTTTSRAPTASR